MQLRFSPMAEADLIDIADYIARDSPAAARRFVAQLEDRCAAILNAPHGGTPRPEIAHDLRSVPFGAYVIFYDVDAEQVTILRVRHSARDLPGLLEGE